MFTNHSSGDRLRIKLVVHCVIILIYKKGNPEVVQLLITNGADVDAQSGKFTPLHYAAAVSINHLVILSSTVLSCID